MRGLSVLDIAIVVMVGLGLISCSGGDEPSGGNAAAPVATPPDGDASDGDDGGDSGGPTVGTQDLRRRWSASWTTQATGYTLRLVFTVDESGAVRGAYTQPGTSAVGTLGGQLMVVDPMTGRVSGTLTFGSNVIFNAEDDVKLTVDDNMIFYLRGHFITTSFPGNLGVDRIDAFASGPIS
jgi:hypothetical protein